MTFLRLYLLVGLVAHKAVWEILKRRQDGRHPTGAAPAPSAFSQLVKIAKTGILAGLVAQTLLPDILPLVATPRLLRIVGVSIYTVGLGVAVLGRRELGTNWSDIEAPQIVQRHTVVSSGIYRFIRHPIYVGDLLLLLGLELSLNSWLVLGVGVLTPVVLQRAVREEHMLSSAVPGYEAYCARTKRFVPYVV